MITPLRYVGPRHGSAETVSDARSGWRSVSVIAVFSIPGSAFVLGRALGEAPGLAVEMEKVVPTGTAVVPYFWVVGTDRADFDAVLAREPGIASFEVVDELEDRALYRVEWNMDVDSIVRVVVEHDAVLQEAGGDADTWTFQLRFPDSHALSEFHDACRETYPDFSVDRLYNPIEPTVGDTWDLTEPQRSLIEEAYRQGYFDVPRKITLVELSDVVGVSDQAVNERMRRGLSTLIATTLAPSDADED